MAFKLRCPECRDTFPWQPAVAFPHFCPLCRADINNDRDDSDVVMPFVRSSTRTASIDNFYRNMEKTSEHRVHLAAEAAGCSPSDMSDLKITNLNDRRDAEVAAMPVSNAVTQRMAEMEAKGLPTGFGVPNAAAYSDSVKSGPHPNAGAKTLGAIQRTFGG
jgi:hypothetical protein